MGINHSVFKPRLTSISTDTAFPAPVTQAGTISHATGTDIVTGSGFLSGKIKVGMYIYAASAAAGSRLRRIKSVDSDTTLHIDSSFGTTLTAVTFTTCYSGQINKMTITSVGTGDGVVDGVTLPKAAGPQPYYNEGGLAPVEVNGSGSNAVLISYQIQSPQ